MSLFSPSAFLQTLDVLASAVVIGVPVWVFFLQGPLLFSFMGRDKFLSPMMHLTGLLFRWTLPGAALMVCLYTVALGYALDSLQMLSAAFALAAVTINATMIVPKALRKPPTKRDVRQPLPWTEGIRQMRRRSTSES